MLRIVSIAAAVPVGAAAFAYAGDQGALDQACDGSTYEMVECLRAKTAKWDKRMTIAYQHMLNAGEPKQREQLRVAQRLWIQYRDANCLYYGLGEGTIARHRSRRLHASDDADRAIELEGKEDRN